MFRLFQSILDCGSCKKSRKESLHKDDLAPEELAPRLEHVKTLSVIAGSMGSSSCTIIGGVIISGRNGGFTIKAPGNADFKVSGHTCSATKQKDQNGNFYVDVTISPGGQLVQYNTRDQQLVVSESPQEESVYKLKP